VNTIRRDLEAFFFKVICEGHRIFAHEPQIAFYLHDENFVELDILVFLIFDLKVGGIKIIITRTVLVHVYECKQYHPITKRTSLVMHAVLNLSPEWNH
jgi:hypothetical protein